MIRLAKLFGNGREIRIEDEDLFSVDNRRGRLMVPTLGMIICRVHLPQNDGGGYIRVQRNTQQR